PTFDVLVEQDSWQRVSLHRDVAAAVDDLLRGYLPTVEVRERDEEENVTAWTETAAHSEHAPNGFVAEAPEHEMRAFGGFDRRAEMGERYSGHGGRNGRSRTLADPRRESPREIFVEAEESRALEEEEPTGTTGALSGVHRAPLGTPTGTRSGASRRLRIYPFGISRERLEQSARQLKVPVEISRDQSQADAVIALKTFYRRQSDQLREAESERKPIYILRTNTVAQMQECLARIFDLRQSEAALTTGHAGNPTTQAMVETEDAIHHMLNVGIGSVELAPQNAYVRRLQHEIAGRYNLESRSRGKDPNRRVQIFGR
ncbi:MAG TPA: R3H domain-containing nucleic acid-binding protein, partial [Ktedonobacterales bacterium]|nr:R3H domain-containing nucleic acid-binding protein [Ktedonobacterales bacterium]